MSTEFLPAARPAFLAVLARPAGLLSSQEHHHTQTHQLMGGGGAGQGMGGGVTARPWLFIYIQYNNILSLLVCLFTGVGVWGRKGVGGRRGEGRWKGVGGKWGRGGRGGGDEGGGAEEDDLLAHRR